MNPIILSLLLAIIVSLNTLRILDLPGSTFSDSEVDWIVAACFVASFLVGKYVLFDSC